jgi:hypothetical protein
LLAICYASLNNYPSEVLKARISNIALMKMGGRGLPNSHPKKAILVLNWWIGIGFLVFLKKILG